MTPKFKKLTYILKKPAIQSTMLYQHNHYLRLINFEMLKKNETVYRSVKFEPLDCIYLEEDFFMRAKRNNEASLIDILDSEMRDQGSSPDLALELLASKKLTSEVNKLMMDQVSGNILTREISQHLKSEYDIFYWKKKYAQSLAVNLVNSLFFLKGSILMTIDHNFERLRIDIASADYIDDNPIFKIELGQKLKAPTKLPLRLTKNNT